MENAKVIELLKHQNQNLNEENASKTSIATIVAQNKISDNSRSKSTAFEKPTASDSKFGQKRFQRRKHKKMI